MVSEFSDQSDLSKRLSRVEQQNRFLILAIVLVILGTGTFMLVGRSTSNKIGTTVEAERFVLRDSKGKERGFLAAEHQGGVGLVLYDGNKNPRLQLDVSVDGWPSLRLLNPGGDALYNAGGAFLGSSRLAFYEKGNVFPPAELSFILGYPLLALKKNSRSIILGGGGLELVILDREGKRTRQWP